MLTNQPSDQRAREQAVDPARSFLVQAPAGSGKTELLTDRILALLATVQRPEEILAITFTRKAASEMHSRVLDKLMAGRGPRPSEPHLAQSWQLARSALQRNDELGWNLLEHPARLSIRTIDSFCAQLVRAMPMLSGLGGMPGITEDAGSHYEAAARETLSLVEQRPTVARLLDHLDVNLAQATDLLAGMLAQRDQWLDHLHESGDVAALERHLEALVEEHLGRLDAHMPERWAAILQPLLWPAAQDLAQRGKDELALAWAGWQGEPFAVTHDALPQWQGLAEMVLTQRGSLRRTVDARQGFPPKSAWKEGFVQWLASVDADAPWLALLHGTRAIPAAGYSAPQEDIIVALLDVLLVSVVKLRFRFLEAGEVDFIEIAQRALQALGTQDSPTDLLLTLDNAIRHILVDEFQDTSHIQIGLLEKLTAGWEPGDGRTLFLVGDPMQSIYRFRKAEVGLFLEVKHHGLGPVHLEPLVLETNFRSQGALVDDVNRLCAPIFPSEDHAGLGAITHAPSVAFNRALDGLGVHFHPVWQPRQVRGEAVRPRHGQRRDACVVTLAREALERYPDSPHPVAILVRSRRHLNDVVARLGEAALPCRAVELVALRSRQVVMDLVQLARALSHPGDRLAWLAVLRSPLGGLSLGTLHGLCGHDHVNSLPAILAAWLAGQHRVVGFDEDQTARLAHVAAVLLDDANIDGSLPFAAWLEQCWTRLGGPAIYHRDSDRADAESVLRLVEQLAPYGNLDPAQLEAGLDRLFAAPSVSGRAIDVMTIHKAKGLEFESVIVLGLENQAQGDRQPLIRFEYSAGSLLLGPVKRSAQESADPISSWLASREKQRSDYEQSRLLYVALTRARSELHIVSQIQLKEDGQIHPPAPSSLLARLWDHLDRPSPPDLQALSLDVDKDAPVAPAAQLWRPVRVPGQGGATTARAPVAAGRMGWGWREQAHAERIAGVVAHAWLERLGRDGLASWSEQRLQASRTLMQRQLSRAGLDQALLDDTTDILLDTLLATVRSERGRWLLDVAGAHREWALLDLTGRVSIIDLAISRDNHWLVVDYKTGVPAADEPIDAYAERMRERHVPQLARYCAHVTALDGRPARAALFFPRVDLWIDCEV